VPQVDDTKFLLIAGLLNCSFGLMLIAGTYVRLIIIVTLIPFNLTLPFLGGGSWSVICRRTGFSRSSYCGRRAPGEEGALVRALRGAGA